MEIKLLIRKQLYPCPTLMVIPMSCMRIMSSMKSIVDSMRMKISNRYCLQVSPIRSNLVEYIMVIPIAICMKCTLGLIL